MTGNKKRSRMRLIRRRHRVLNNLPLRSDAGVRRKARTHEEREREDEDLDTPNDELIGVTD